MPRYIDAERIPNDNFFRELSDKEKSKVIQWFLTAPTVDVQEVKYGKWREVYKNDIATVYECTNCKHLTFGTSDYCICGAKMDRKDDK